MVIEYYVTDTTDYNSIFNFAQFDPSNFEPDAIRKICFDVIIRDDEVQEEMESFTIALELDTFVLQSGIIVEPNVTEIFILDNDGT